MTNDQMTTPSVEEGGTVGASKKFVVSAIVVASIVVLGLVLSVTSLIGGGKAEPSPSSAPVVESGSDASAAPEAPAGEASVCGLEAVEMVGTVGAPPAAMWTLVGTTAAPSVEGQGPGKIDDDGYRSCYARTPTGALLAAANYAAMGSSTPLRKKFYEEGIVPGPGRDILLGEPVGESGGSGNTVQIAGFRILRYDGNQADVDIALRTSRGAKAAVVTHLEWSDGDWKMRLTDEGKPISPVVQIPNLSGYLLWSGA